LIKYGRLTDREWVGPIELSSVSSFPREPGLYALVVFRKSRPARISRFLEIDSSGPQGWTTLGRVFEAQGHPSQAQAAQQQARGRQQEHDDDNNDDASSVQDMLSGVDPGPF
jgi:hypothetical protein